MIGIDVSPLLLERPRGVARALGALLVGLSRVERREPVVLLTPREPEDDARLPSLDGIEVVSATSARRFRLAVRGRAASMDTFVSPWLASARSDSQTVVWVHELPFVRLGPIEGRLRAFRQRVWLRRHAASGARFVVPSRATQADVLALHPELAERVHVIAHGFDPAPWIASRRAPDDPAYAVVVGTGRGAAGARKKGIDRAARMRAPLGSALDVRIVGDSHLPDDELRRIVAGARVLICPSRSEGFGLPTLEAMAAGVPVVSTDGGALPEVVGDAALVVPGGDADTLADAALRAATDEALRARLIEAGDARCRAFPPEASALAWLGLAERVR